MSRPLLIRGGRVVDPAAGRDMQADVLLVDGTVADVAPELRAPPEAEVLDASGLVVTPGLIDVHVHFREPGQEHKETIATGSAAAAAGGFTAVVAMPNTQPPIDTPERVVWLRGVGAAALGARVYPVGTISKGRQGAELADVDALVAAGAVAITDDGDPILDSGLMRTALEAGKRLGIPVADHPEDLGLSGRGVMNEGAVSARLGVPGKPNAAEDVHIVRDLMVAEHTGGHIHLQHVSTRGGVDAIRRAKARGVRVTAEATPHHLILTDEAIEDVGTNAKMNPPLRAAEDVAAVREGLRDGTLDTLATDHAPHHRDEKALGLVEAPNGIVGLETSLGLALTHLVGEGLIDLMTLIDRMSAAPVRAFGLPGGSLEPGMPGDVTIIDLAREWIVEPKGFASRSDNTPFAGWTLTGGPWATVVGGRTVWSYEDR
jgi:dihydroorotase